MEIYRHTVPEVFKSKLWNILTEYSNGVRLKNGAAVIYVCGRGLPPLPPSLPLLLFLFLTPSFLFLPLHSFLLPWPLPFLSSPPSFPSMSPSLSLLPHSPSLPRSPPLNILFLFFPFLHLFFPLSSFLFFSSFAPLKYLLEQICVLGIL